MKKPMVSVIVPTYRDRERLAKCVARILDQSYDAARLELIVVDNDLEHQESIAECLDCERVTVISEPIPGSYRARNSGAKIASGEILAFTDSDCQPQSDWVLRLVDCFESTGADLVSGSVNMQAGQLASITAVEAYDMVTGIRQDVFAKDERGATANLAVTMQQFQRVDGFDSTRFSGGDMDFCRRVKVDGGRFAFCQEAIVLHPLRSEWSDVLKKARRMAGSKANVDREELRRSVPRMIAAQFTGFRLICAAPELCFIQKVKATSVLCVVKFVQICEFFRVLLLRSKAVR